MDSMYGLVMRVFFVCHGMSHLPPVVLHEQPATAWMILGSAGRKLKKKKSWHFLLENLKHVEKCWNVEKKCVQSTSRNFETWKRWKILNGKNPQPEHSQKPNGNVCEGHLCRFQVIFQTPKNMFLRRHAIAQSQLRWIGWVSDVNHLM